MEEVTFKVKDGVYIKKSQVARLVMPFEGNEDTYLKNDIEGNSVKIPYFNNGGYFIIYDKLADKIMAGQYRLTGNDFQVLMAIVKCLKLNSNIVDVSNITLYNLTGIKPQNISKNLANLEECRLIQRRGGKIITNVNYLFKGNLLDFYRAYKEMYPEDKGFMY